MIEAMERIIRIAREKFVGHGPVIGVGLVENGRPKIQFLLTQDSASAKAEIERWAEYCAVSVLIDVVGSNVPLSDGY
jgi:hypothetical protein